MNGGLLRRSRGRPLAHKATQTKGRAVRERSTRGRTVGGRTEGQVRIVNLASRKQKVSYAARGLAEIETRLGQGEKGR